MKGTLRTMTVCLAVVLLVSGCAIFGERMSDEDMIRQTVATMKTALEAKDIGTLMTVFSEEFHHPEVGGKEEGRAMLQMAVDAGYADDGEVFTEDMEINILEDGTATVYPIDLSGPPGSVSVELVLKKEEAGWLITTVNPDGI